MELATELTAIRNELKAITKMLRKMKNVQEDPDGVKAQARAKNNGFNRLMEISPELREFIGLPDGELISRSQVTRELNKYITTNSLKHPDNGRIIILDDKLTQLLKPDSGVQVTFLNIQKYLSPHYVKTVEPSPVVDVVPPVVEDVKVEPAVKPKASRPVVVKKTKA